MFLQIHTNFKIVLIYTILLKMQWLWLNHSSEYIYIYSELYYIYIYILEVYRMWDFQYSRIRMRILHFNIRRYRMQMRILYILLY